MRDDEHLMRNNRRTSTNLGRPLRVRRQSSVSDRRVLLGGRVSDLAVSEVSALQVDNAYGGCKYCRVHVWERNLRGRRAVLRRGEQHVLHHIRGCLDRDVHVRVHWYQR